MKEVRYNDRIWFGKHKGMRFCELIKHDPNFIQKMVLDGKIKLDTKTTMVFEQNYGRIKKAEPWQPRPGMLGHPGNQPQLLDEMSIRWTYLELPMMKNFIHKMVEDLHRNDHIPHQFIQILSDKFFMKVRGLNFEENGIFTFRMTRNRENPIDFGGLVLHVMTNNNEEIGCFDLT